MNGTNNTMTMDMPADVQQDVIKSQRIKAGKDLALLVLNGLRGYSQLIEEDIELLAYAAHNGKNAECENCNRLNNRINDLSKTIYELNENIKSLNGECDGLRSERDSAENDVVCLRIKDENRAETINELDKKISSLKQILEFTIGLL